MSARSRDGRDVALAATALVNALTRVADRYELTGLEVIAAADRAVSLWCEGEPSLARQEAGASEIRDRLGVVRACLRSADLGDPTPCLDAAIRNSEIAETLLGLLARGRPTVEDAEAALARLRASWVAAGR